MWNFGTFGGQDFAYYLGRISLGSPDNLDLNSN